MSASMILDSELVREGSPTGDVAIYSPCMKYRYLLTRNLQHPGLVLGCIGLNPSTATAFVDDPTIRKVRGFAHRWGYKSLLMGNAFGLRSTDPKGLGAVEDPVGPHNVAYLKWIIEQSDRVLVAWGTNGHRYQRNLAMSVVESVCWNARANNKELVALRETKDGHPFHPLYVSYSVQPHRWQ